MKITDKQITDALAKSNDYVKVDKANIVGYVTIINKDGTVERVPIPAK